MDEAMEREWDDYQKHELLILARKSNYSGDSWIRKIMLYMDYRRTIDVDRL